jgi:DNA transposition AAA+ family ATPase
VIWTESPSPFLMTSQYRRFAEICNKSESSKFISLFYGKTGLGKTECALHYANWRTVEPLLEKSAGARKVPLSIVQCGSAVYTPDVGATQKMVQSGIALLRNRFDDLVDQSAAWHRFDTGDFYPHKYLKLLIIDEADRLKLGALETIRDIYDRTNLSVLLIGSPGIDRRLKRSGYGQLHSRFTLAYEIQQLNAAEMRLFISLKWKELDLPLTADDAVSTAIMRIANGNFRALHRIFVEIKRLQKLNCFPMVTPDLVEVARQGLLLGST